MLFQGMGLAGGILLCDDGISGYYISSFVWFFFFCYAIINIFYLQKSTSVMIKQAVPFYSWLLLFFGIPILFVLFRELIKIKKNDNANIADVNNHKVD